MLKLLVTKNGIIPTCAPTAKTTCI